MLQSSNPLGSLDRRGAADGAGTTSKLKGKRNIVSPVHRYRGTPLPGTSGALLWFRVFITSSLTAARPGQAYSNEMRQKHGRSNSFFFKRFLGTHFPSLIKFILDRKDVRFFIIVSFFYFQYSLLLLTERKMSRRCCRCLKTTEKDVVTHWKQFFFLSVLRSDTRVLRIFFACSFIRQRQGKTTRRGKINFFFLFS